MKDIPGSHAEERALLISRILSETILIDHRDELGDSPSDVEPKLMFHILVPSLRSSALSWLLFCLLPLEGNLATALPHKPHGGWIKEAWAHNSLSLLLPLHRHAQVFGPER